MSSKDVVVMLQEVLRDKFDGKQFRLSEAMKGLASESGGEMKGLSPSTISRILNRTKQALKEDQKVLIRGLLENHGDYSEKQINEGFKLFEKTDSLSSRASSVWEFVFDSFPYYSGRWEVNFSLARDNLMRDEVPVLLPGGWCQTRGVELVGSLDKNDLRAFPGVSEKLKDLLVAPEQSEIVIMKSPSNFLFAGGEDYGWKLWFEGRLPSLKNLNQGSNSNKYLHHEVVRYIPFLFSEDYELDVEFIYKIKKESEKINVFTAFGVAEYEEEDNYQVIRIKRHIDKDFSRADLFLLFEKL